MVRPRRRGSLQDRRRARREGCERVCRAERLLARRGLSDDAGVVLVDHSDGELHAALTDVAHEMTQLFPSGGMVSPGLRHDLNAVHVRVAAAVSGPDLARLRAIAAGASARVVLELTDYPNLFVEEL